MRAAQHSTRTTHECPKFVAMTQKERFCTCREAKIYLACISFKVIFSTAHLDDFQRRKAVKSGTKDEYTCSVAACANPIWT